MAEILIVEDEVSINELIKKNLCLAGHHCAQVFDGNDAIALAGREKFDLIIGNIITEKEVQDQVGYGCYDIVAANILADVLVPLTPVIVHQLKPGGVYITSGIIDNKEQTVRDAVEAAGLEVIEVTAQGEWVSVTARKPA